MTAKLRPLFVAAAVLSLAACDRVKNPEGRHLTVLFTTDEHSNLFAVGPEVDDFDLVNHTISHATGSGSLKGGVARRYAILQAERAAASARNADAITLSAGDFTEGSLANAALLSTTPAPGKGPDFELMKLMGYDAMAIGNHEFDFGPTGLAGEIALAMARTGGTPPPLVLTNALTTGTPLESLYGAGKAIAPSRVVTSAGGIKVGIVSWMGVGAGTDAAAAAPVTFWSATATTPEQQFAEIAASVQAAVNSLRQNDGVDTVIALGHGGIGPVVAGTDANGNIVMGPGDDEIITSLVSGLDLVVSGHSHRTPDQPYVVNGADGRGVPLLQPAPYGHEIGRVELIIPSGERAVVNSSQTAFIPVDDRTAPTTDEGIVGELLATIGGIETGFVPATLLATGICSGADPTCYTAAHVGDLYYKPICHTTFYTRGLGGGESNVANLDTDAMLATASALGAPATLSLQNYGSIRTDLFSGRTGELSFADLYRAVPNGVDPGTVTPGFPLVRVGISTVELRIAFEATLLKSMVDGDYFVSPSGLRVEYDTTRAMFPVDADPIDPFAPGWVTRMALTNADGSEAQVLYDVTQPGAGGTHFLVNPSTSVQPVVTTYFVASFAGAFGLTLRDLSQPTAPPLADLGTAILRWPGGTLGTSNPPTGVGNAVKDHQAFLKYVSQQCAGNGGNLPSRYDDAATDGRVPRRVVDCVSEPSACAH